MHHEIPTRTVRFGSEFFAFVKDENRRFGRSPAERKQSSDPLSAPRESDPNRIVRVGFLFFPTGFKRKIRAVFPYARPNRKRFRQLSVSPFHTDRYSLFQKTPLYFFLSHVKTVKRLSNLLFVWTVRQTIPKKSK